MAMDDHDTQLTLFARAILGSCVPGASSGPAVAMLWSYLALQPYVAERHSETE